MSERIGAVAHVSVELEVSVGPYGDDWNLADIMKQARREAPELIRNRLATSSGIRIVGTPTVDIVITSEKK